MCCLLRLLHLPLTTLAAFPKIHLPLLALAAFSANNLPLSQTPRLDVIPEDGAWRVYSSSGVKPPFTRASSRSTSDGGFYRRTIPFPAHSNIYHKIKSSSKQSPKKRHIRIQNPKNTFVGPVFLRRFAGEEIVRKINRSVSHRRPHTNCKGSERERERDGGDRGREMKRKLIDVKQIPSNADTEPQRS